MKKKDLKRKLRLATELVEKKDIEIESLKKQLWEAKLSPVFIECLEAMDELDSSKESICLTCARKDECKSLKAFGFGAVTECVEYASENFTVLTDADGKEFGVLTEVWDGLIENGKVMKDKVGKITDEKIEEGEVAFSSRFMPNVKFSLKGVKLTNDLISFFKKEAYDYNLHATFLTGLEGETLYAKVPSVWNDFPIREVSIYEAIPEIPKPSGYEKEAGNIKIASVKGRDSHPNVNFLIFDEPVSMKEWVKKNVCPFSKQDLSDKEFILCFMPSYNFSYNQCELILNEFGREKFEDILKLCTVTNISPEAFLKQ